MRRFMLKRRNRRFMKTGQLTGTQHTFSKGHDKTGDCHEQEQQGNYASGF